MTILALVPNKACLIDFLLAVHAFSCRHEALLKVCLAISVSGILQQFDCPAPDTL